MSGSDIFLRRFIAGLGEIPAGSQLMDAPFVEACKNFKGSNPLCFLRDLRDALVHDGGCVDGMISSISCVISAEPPETAKEMDQRRIALRCRRREGQAV